MHLQGVVLVCGVSMETEKAWNKIFTTDSTRTGSNHNTLKLYLVDMIHNVCLCWSFTAQSTTRSCRAGQLTLALFLGRLRPSTIDGQVRFFFLL